MIEKPLSGQDTYLDPNYSDGLVAFYPINEGVGTKIHDISGNENHISFPSSSTVWDTCVDGHCLKFDNGATSGIIGTGAKALPTNTGSFSVWVSVDALAQDDGIITLHDGSNQNRVFIFYNSASNPNSQLQLNSNYGGTGVIVWYITPVPSYLEQAGRLHHIVATWDFDQDIVNMYINGQQLTPTGTNPSGVPSGLDQISLGSFHLTSIFPLDGNISNAMVYNRVLTQAEAVVLYQDPYWGFRNG